MTEWFLSFEGGRWVVLLRQEYDDRPIRLAWHDTLEQALCYIERSAGQTVMIPLLVK